MICTNDKKQTKRQQNGSSYQYKSNGILGLLFPSKRSNSSKIPRTSPLLVPNQLPVKIRALEFGLSSENVRIYDELL